MPRRAKDYIGDCFGNGGKCGGVFQIFKTKSYKRFAKCSNEYCPGTREKPDKTITFPLPKKGHIEYTGSRCPLSLAPILVVSSSENSRYQFRSYFWSFWGPCFSCEYYECGEIKTLIKEYTECRAYGFK